MSVRLSVVPDVEPSEELQDTGFEVVYRRYFPRLVRMLRRRIANSELAEDIAQDALLKAYQNIDSFDPSRPMWPWLKTIALHLLYDQGRKSAREVVWDGAPPGEEEPNWFAPDALPEAMAKLPHRHQLALSLRYMDDWETTQVADFLGLSRGALEQLLFRARRRLKTEYVRLSESALGLAVVPRAVRRWVLRESLRIKRVADSGGGTWAATDIPVQLTAGVLALVTAVGAAGPTLPRGSDGATNVTRSADMRTGGGVDRSNRGDRLTPNRVAVAASSSKTGDDFTGPNEGTKTSVRKVADRFTDPNRDVKQPEDTTIVSLAAGSKGRVYAVGHHRCALETCPRVLFRSTDGGGTWERLPAIGLSGDSLLIPESSPRLMFAMGGVGLQVSRNGGRSFAAATSVGPRFAGSAAISPSFDLDPTILIGAQTLMRYRWGADTAEPVASNMAGPLRPAFSPGWPADPKLFVGGTRLDADSGSWISTIFTCVGTFCSERDLPGDVEAPYVKPDPYFTSNGRLFAFTHRMIYRSTDGAHNFKRLPAAWGTTSLKDLEPSWGRHLYAATSALDGSPVRAGVWKSLDDGNTWRPLRDPLLRHGVTQIEVNGDLLLAALKLGGVACSADAGETWRRRC